MSEYAKLLESANSKFAQALKAAKIDPVRLLGASHELEALRPEDRAIKNSKKAASGKDDDAAKAARAKKPRSGRPLTDRSLRAAIEGKDVSGPTKHRIVRALNAVLAVKKQPETDLRKLFSKK